MKHQIIYEDSDILVCYKPPGLATQTAGLGNLDLVSMLKNYLAVKEKMKNPYLGILHRLDQPVSGLLVFAKHKRAAAGLSEQIKEGLANKDYLALCCGNLKQETGEFCDYIRRHPITKQAEVLLGAEAEEDSILQKARNICPETAFIPRSREDRELPGVFREGYKKAVLSYETVRKWEDAALLRVRLKTGRFHQIRAQFSAHGSPLLGDMKYGNPVSREISANKGINKIALCADRLEFKHPVTQKIMKFQLGREHLPEWTN